MNKKLPDVGYRLALTGRRNVGKSTAARALERLGFVRIHAFDGGKVAAQAYFAHILEGRVDCEEDYAYDMVYGNLKDVPCDLLPGGVAPRKFLEDFGRFMGVDMGIEWTLKAEIDRTVAIHGPDVNIVADSMVYESDYWKTVGGKVVRLERPDFDGQPSVSSDAHQATIKEDASIMCHSPQEVGLRVVKYVTEQIDAEQKKIGSLIFPG